MDDQPTQPLTDQPMRPEGGCSLTGPNGSRIPIEEPHSYSARKGANTIFVRTCELCGEIDWDALHEATVERVAIEVDRLRAENTAQAAKLAAGRAVLTDRITKWKVQQAVWQNMPTSAMSSADWLNVEFEQRRLGEVEDLLDEFDAALGLDQAGEGQA